jgi:hypothetical protein
VPKKTAQDSLTLQALKDQLLKQLIDYCYRVAPEVRVPNVEGSTEADSLLKAVPDIHADLNKVKDTFLVARDRQYRNRQATYYLARQLISRVIVADSAIEIELLIKGENLKKLRTNSQIAKLGDINSSEFQRIIKTARSGISRLSARKNIPGM